MITELLTVGTAGIATGVAAVTFWKKNGNGKHDPPPPQQPPLQQQQAAKVEIEWPPGLLERLENPSTITYHAAEPAWPEIVGELERITKRMLVASRETKPEWATHIESDLAENDKRLERIAADLSENMADGMARFYSQVSKDLAAAVNLPALAEIAERLESIVDAIPEPDQRDLTAELSRQLAEFPARFSSQLAEMFAAERNRIVKSTPHPGSIKAAANPGGGSGGNLPVRRAPPSQPRAAPGPQIPAPQIPAAYVGGQVWVDPGQPWNLLALIQQQLSPNCPGTGAELAIDSDPDNTAPIFLGAASSLGGPLSDANYAFILSPTSPARIYRSTYPGNNTPLGELQVFAHTGGYLHVEVQS